MRATVIHAPRDIRLDEVPDPVLSTGVDAIVRVVAACVCGSDLWPYRGVLPTAAPHRILDPDAGPLIGVKLHILTRKTLGGIQTDLTSRALGLDGQPIGGLYAAGEVAGFGGGGVHGYNALEGTFLGGCIFSGRVAGRAV